MPDDPEHLKAAAAPESEAAVADRREALQALLNHASLAWAAEEERARHLQRERQLVLGLLLTLTGGLLAAAATLTPDLTFWWRWLALLAFLLAVLGAGISLLELVPLSTRGVQDWMRKVPGLRERELPAPSSRAEVSASEHLKLPKTVLTLDDEDAETVLEVSGLQTYDAFIDLNVRNNEVLAHTRASGSGVLIGIFFGILGILVALAGQPDAPGVSLDDHPTDGHHHHEHFHHEHLLSGNRAASAGAIEGGEREVGERGADQGPPCGGRG